MTMGVLAHCSPSVGPENADAVPPDGVCLAGACRDHAHVLDARLGDRGALVDASRRLTGVEHEPDGDRIEHVDSPANVIPMGMGEHDRSEAPHPEAPQLVGYLGF